MFDRFWDFCLVFVSCFILGAVGGCSGAPGEDGEGDGVKVVHVDTGGADGVSDIGSSDGDSGSVTDPGGSTDDGSFDGDDVPDVVDYPQPGTIEYWMEVVPGHWKQSPTCVNPFEPDGCETDLVVVDLEAEGLAEVCSGTKYALWATSGELGSIGNLCLFADGRLNKESSQGVVHLVYDGFITEHVVNTGECSVKADGMPPTCIRHADCAVASAGATCAGMQVEYWIDFCGYNKGEGESSCDVSEKDSYHFLKVSN